MVEVGIKHLLGSQSRGAKLRNNLYENSFLFYVDATGHSFTKFGFVWDGLT